MRKVSELSGARWTEDEKKILLALFPTSRTRDMVPLIGRTYESIESAAKRFGIKKADGYDSASHRFKKGSISHSTRPVGYTRQNVLGYMEIKTVKGKGKWRMLHREIWKKEHGEYPEKGVLITFKDGNRQNCDINNLELKSRKEMMMENSMNNLPEELQEIVRMKGTVTLLINSRLNNGK